MKGALTRIIGIGQPAAGDDNAGIAVARAMRDCPLMSFVGVWEPDPSRREEVLAEADSPYAGLTWFGSLEEMLGDESIEAVACEGANDESLDQAEQIVAAGKHLWLDKPAGENWAQWAAVVASAQAQQLHVQLGFMLRYHPAFIQLADWARSGFLGSVFKVLPARPTPPALGFTRAAALQVRGDMSKPALDGNEARYLDYPHAGGIFFDLGGHMVE